MICKPCRVAADYGLPGIHRRCAGCSCEHRPLIGPAREQAGAFLRNLLLTVWQPIPGKEQQ